MIRMLAPVGTLHATQGVGFVAAGMSARGLNLDSFITGTVLRGGAGGSGAFLFLDGKKSVTSVEPADRVALSDIGVFERCAARTARYTFSERRQNPRSKRLHTWPPGNAAS
eukprot:1512386-Prymnesium_polylepis.1